MGYVTVDPDALRKLGSNLRNSGAVIGTEAAGIGGHDFGPAQAGSAYGPEGKKVHDGLGRLGAWLKNWQGAVEQTGAQFARRADEYVATDASTVHRIKAVGVQL
ncbi:hypothetical protein [Nocardia transvalensis]|uniref:hypothetical protein n=1 Tax=Nocardia transvalensis TaxID=37333 RepID=UPI00189347F8|nr:hypothetical protein [Nocardia transvalensis]MBF6327451.1 hypothetical protein [Nocardia transvalensis]